MTIEQAKEILEMWKYKGSDGLTDERLGYIEGWYHKKDDAAFEMAIKSLEMWDKVIKELWEYKKPLIIDNGYIKHYIGIADAVEIIEKCKEEIEE